MSSPPRPKLPAELAERLDALFRSDRYARQLGVELVEWSLGRAVVSGQVRADHVNFVGMGHGAFTFALADIAMSFASNSHGRICPAIHADISFLRAARPDDVLVATATVVEMTRRVSRIELKVTADGRSIAAATGTTYRTDDWHFGTEAWPEAWRGAH